MATGFFNRIGFGKMCSGGAVILILFAAVGAGGQGPSTDPFVGTWIWNAKASRLTNQRLSIKFVGNNTYTIDTHYGTLMTVVADGTPQTVSAGTTLSLRQVAADTWEVADKGTYSTSGTYKISADGQTLKSQKAIAWADGGTENRETIWQRIGSGNGLPGEWESKTVDSQSSSKPFELRFASTNDGFLIESLPGMKVQYTFRLDGKDYPDPNVDVPKGTMIATTRKGPNAIHLESKLNGTLVESDDFELSSDGRTMTVREVDAGQHEPMLFTMERQSK